MNQINGLIEDLIEEINIIRQNLNETLPTLRSEVDFILTGHITSIPQIEGLLDRLLDYALFGCDDGEFRRLNEYYSTVNKANSDEYDRIYNEFLD